jgi:hypothetical protein
MKKLPVVCGLFLALSCTALLRAEAAKPEFFRGEIKKVEEKSITVNDHVVPITGSTVVVQDQKEVKTTALAVGQNVTARVEGGNAVRIEIHPAKK